MEKTHCRPKTCRMPASFGELSGSGRKWNYVLGGSDATEEPVKIQRGW